MVSMEQLLQSIESDIESLEEKNPTFKAMIYGSFGVGKTCGAVAIAQRITPADKTILYLDTNDGWASLQNHPSLKRRVLRYRLDSLSAMVAIASAINNATGLFADVGCVIVDEHTTISENNLLKITRKRAESDKTKDPDTPTWPDMATNMYMITTNIQALLDAKAHIILLAHEKVDKDDKQVTITGPMYQAKLRAKVLNVLHIAVRLTADELEKDGTIEYSRIYRAHPTRRIIAKSRVGGLGPEVTYETLVNQTIKWLGGEAPTQEKEIIYPDAKPESKSEEDEPSFEGIEPEGE